MTSPAVVLLSGGIDSATTLAIAQQRGHTCHALTFDYGQRHAREVRAARDIAEAAQIAEHRTIRIDLEQFGGSALTDRTIDIPRNQLGAPGIPATYVPARNTIFLAHALAYAETINARHIFIGCNHDDQTGYPDCRAAYLKAFGQMANLATRASVEGHPLRIQAPVLRMAKASIVRHGHNLGVDFALTWSCYAPTNAQPCQQCDACLLRAHAFHQAGIPDPAAEA